MSDQMTASRMTQALVRGILLDPSDRDIRAQRLLILEGMLRDAATCAYTEAEEHRNNSAPTEAVDYYLREWSALGCVADYVQGIHVAKTRPVTPQLV